MAAISGRRRGTPITVGTKTGTPRRPEDVRVAPVTAGTRADAWRALVHASRDLEEYERLAWLREMNSMLGLVERPRRLPGRCECGNPVPLRTGGTTRRTDGRCTDCVKARPR